MKDFSKLFAIKIMIQELPDYWSGSKRAILQKIDRLIETELNDCTPEYCKKINELNRLIENEL